MVSITFSRRKSNQKHPRGREKRQSGKAARRPHTTRPGKKKKAGKHRMTAPPRPGGRMPPALDFRKER